MKNLLMIALTTLASSTAFAYTCNSGDSVTVARPFRYIAPNGSIDSMQVGTVLALDNLYFQDGVRAIADLTNVEGKGVRPVLNQSGKITGCSVDWQRTSSIHVCAGPMGGCAETFAPRSLTFFECDINP